MGHGSLRSVTVSLVMFVVLVLLLLLVVLGSCAPPPATRIELALGGLAILVQAADQLGRAAMRDAQDAPCVPPRIDSLSEATQVREQLSASQPLDAESATASGNG